jgi:hypothetical protein
VTNEKCNQPGCLVNHEAYNTKSISKSVAPNGDVHIVFVSTKDPYQVKLVHAVSKDGEKTWEYTSDEEMQRFIQGIAGGKSNDQKS